VFHYRPFQYGNLSVSFHKPLIKVQTKIRELEKRFVKTLLFQIFPDAFFDNPGLFGYTLGRDVAVYVGNIVKTIS